MAELWNVITAVMESNWNCELYGGCRNAERNEVLFKLQREVNECILLLNNISILQWIFGMST